MPLRDVACARVHPCKRTQLRLESLRRLTFAPRCSLCLLKWHGSSGNREYHRGHRYLHTSADSWTESGRIIPGSARSSFEAFRRFHGSITETMADYVSRLLGKCTTSSRSAGKCHREYRQELFAWQLLASLPMPLHFKPDCSEIARGVLLLRDRPAPLRATVLVDAAG